MAHPIDSVADFAVPVLAAFGLDSNRVTGFTIRCEVGEPVTITVTKMAPAGAGKAAAQVAELFELTLRSSMDLGDRDESVSVGTLVRTIHRLEDSREWPRT